jgi:hypothetical protein
MTNEHWRYFLALEQDVERTTRFVEPHASNYKAFSIEFARLILSTCSEVDVVAKVLCHMIAPTAKAENMDDYRDLIGATYPKFHTMIVTVPRFGLAMEPWKEWGSGTNPGWWKDHQLVKHQRHKFFHLADLEHCLVSAAGLFSIILYLCHNQIIALEPSAFFDLALPAGAKMAMRYTLPDFCS